MEPVTLTTKASEKRKWKVKLTQVEAVGTCSPEAPATLERPPGELVLSF